MLFCLIKWITITIQKPNSFFQNFQFSRAYFFIGIFSRPKAGSVSTLDTPQKSIIFLKYNNLGPLSKKKWNCPSPEQQKSETYLCWSKAGLYYLLSRQQIQHKTSKDLLWILGDSTPYQNDGVQVYLQPRSAREIWKLILYKITTSKLNNRCSLPGASSNFH